MPRITKMADAILVPIFFTDDIMNTDWQDISMSNCSATINTTGYTYIYVTFPSIYITTTFYNSNNVSGWRSINFYFNMQIGSTNYPINDKLTLSYNAIGDSRSGTLPGGSLENNLTTTSVTLSIRNTTGNMYDSFDITYSSCIIKVGLRK